MIGAFTLSDEVSDQQQISRLKHIAHYFDADYLIGVFKPLVENGRPVSLRLVDWAAVNYSKQFPVRYVVDDGNGGQTMFNMHNSYRQWLKIWRRKGFDIFRRRHRIHFLVDQKPVYTTIAQVNFMLWMKLNKVLEWCEENKEIIEKNMVETLSKSKQERIANRRKKRSELVKGDCRPTLKKQRRNIVFDS
jgi:hypothetical protein